MSKASDTQQLIRKAERVADWSESPGCSAWACQVAPIIRQLAKALEKAEREQAPLFKDCRHG